MILEVRFNKHLAEKALAFTTRNNMSLCITGFMTRTITKLQHPVASSAHYHKNLRNLKSDYHIFSGAEIPKKTTKY
ncbi:hypothetical protein A2662_00060 [Candidatus Giovannonibacteria bacterium RIFCSPHIGHO2_01_FULL_45_33]|uniref:Uncharacterized protein n=1 Tax=Candidatus Giovannonibacteria bacterium RIFCSPLOWO2_01_FULL_45_34 TaxID=1798351 RepID=A0A1F5WZY8_9BACT|nr:MAG: hypothetical protein A2662_00060 [Candidatus Giovannonibacteria bacterium RIFCSPHIGHO2_01_FULL_45_33]OGF69552.1 MAG: hypothetical protein A3C73_01915 [Candidatus Giovannonibacteria bacterium RIFCSPHIGHO2_02_FULL_44_11]OGF80881.1 MAG: hypothetical protein A2930_01030 [Candidatus Giovannonibacteria bacterium RIFCSPLOWO2_01_FULL_45_34]